MNRILIVDGAVELGRLLKAALLTMNPGFKITVMPSGEEAYFESTCNPVDLLVADIRLPGISSLELVKKFRSRFPKVKVILITGLNDEGIEKEVQKLDIDALISKPFQVLDFLATVRSSLGMEPIGEEKPIKREKPSKEIISAVSTENGLSSILASLRQRLDAFIVLVLNSRGRIMAKAGNLPF